MPARRPARFRLAALLAASVLVSLSGGGQAQTQAQVHSDSPSPARQHSHRLIVELESPSTAVAMGVGNPVVRAGRMALRRWKTSCLWNEADSLASLDLNPVLVGARGEGAVVVDALVDCGG